jgi:hypothetical protein
MTRYVVTTTTTVAASGYAQPARTLNRGQVVELSAAEVVQVGSGNLRTVTMHDQLAESAGISNGD